MGAKPMVTIDRTEKFDAIVIGSGIGGLTVAALMSKLQNKRVLVLEQHFTPGGFTHGFDRKGKFHWDVGLHYIGELGKGSPFRAILDYLSDGKLKWQKLPDPFEKFVYPDFTFDVYSDPQRYQADLIRQFPNEKIAIRRYFKDVQTAAFWFIANGVLELFPHFLQPLVKRIFRKFDRIARQTTQRYLDKNFQDVRLKALLVSQWGDYGLPPSMSCFGIHGIIVTHFLEGAWYPVGGGNEIAKTILPSVEQAGGKIITQRRVTEILIESGVAVGVKVQNVAHPVGGASLRENRADEIYYAPIVISNAGVFNTFVKLIPPSYPLRDREAIRAFPKGTTILSLYIGFKESPQKLGFQGENHWIFDTYDQEEIAYAPPISAAISPRFAYLSFPSLKDPLAKGHTAELLAGGEYDSFLEWQQQSWRRRDADYQSIKAEITESLIDYVEHRYPGFRDLIEYTELATPLTIEHFAASDRGGIYGIPCLPERFDLPWISSKTPIKNLYLTGCDTFFAGLIGSMIGGIKTAGFVDGMFGFLKITIAILFHKYQRPGAGDKNLSKDY
jgi:all-trans-retinol 13,14-reductase